MVDILNKLIIATGDITDYIRHDNIVLDPAGTAIESGIWDGGGVSGAIYETLGITKTKMNNSNSITALKPTKVKRNNFDGQYILHIHSPNGIVIKNEGKFIKALEDSYNTIFNEFSKHLNDLKKNKLVKPNNLVLVSVSGGIYCGGYCEKMPELTINAIQQGYRRSALSKTELKYNIILVNNDKNVVEKLKAQMKEKIYGKVSEKGNQDQTKAKTAPIDEKDEKDEKDESKINKLSSWWERQKTPNTIPKTNSITNFSKKKDWDVKQIDLVDATYSRFAEKDSCNLNQLLIAPLDYKCDAGSKNKGECDIKKHLLPLLNSHPIFKEEKNRVFIDKYVKPQAVKYCKKNKTNLNSLIILLKCIKEDISKIYKFINKIHNYKYDKNSNKYHNYKLSKNKLTKKKGKNKSNTKSKKNNFTSNSNNDGLFNEYKNEFETTIIKTLVELLVEIIIIPIYYFNKFDKSKKKTTIKTEFEKIIKEIDTGNSLITSYKNLLNYKETTGIKTNVDNNFDTEINSLKNKYISILSSAKTKKTITNLHELELLKEEQDSLLSINVSFDEKRNSKYLFFVLGMLLFAILLKFNLLA
jgi:hypothetical protein